MQTSNIAGFLKKNTMVIALVLVVIIFSVSTGGKILLPQNINNLISQNGYVFVLATGMLLCILTGGNIDLSVGSVVCFTMGIGALILKAGAPTLVAVLAMLAVGLCVGMFQGGIQALSRSYFAKIIPPEKSGEYFGFLDICGKGAAFLGTIVMSAVSQITGSINLGVLPIACFFLMGILLFRRSLRETS